MSDDELTEKFRDQAEPVLGADETRQLGAAVWDLDAASAPDSLFSWRVSD